MPDIGCFNVCGSRRSDPSTPAIQTDARRRKMIRDRLARVSLPQRSKLHVRQDIVNAPGNWMT